MRIGHYELHDELARGGMGVVYRATDSRSGAQVVVKLLKVDSDKGRRRLRREADAMRRLTHPSVVTLYDTGEHGGQPYLVLPYVEGESLQDRLDREGPFPVEDVLSIATQVAEGLQAAHALGLLHRDVKPANVLVDRRLHGQVKLTDFGLVKDTTPGLQASASLSIKGRFLGTPGYWPPEQARGELGQLGPPADVYAFGALLYALLSGRPPRGGETLIQALDALEHPVPSLDAHVPRWLDDLVLRCLEIPLAARPTLPELLLALEHRAPLGAASAPQPFARPQRRLPGWAFVAVGVACGLVSGGSVAAWRWRSAARDAAATQRAAEIAADTVAKREAGLLEEALLDLERALALDPDSVDALLQRAACLAELERPQEALRGLERALELAPSDPRVRYARGACLGRLGRNEEALADYARVLELDPTHLRAWANQGSARSNLGRYAEALADYDRALELDPRHVLSLYNRGRTKSKLQRYEDAIVDYDRALELDPALGQAYHSRGVAKAQLQRHREALSDFDRALEFDPLDAAAYCNRGLSKASLSGAEAALIDQERACQLQPDRPDFRRARGDCYRSLERLEEALADYDRWVELEVGRAAPYASRGVCLGELGRHAAALADLDRALELGLPADARSWVEAARAESAAALEDSDAAPPPAVVDPPRPQGAAGFEAELQGLLRARSYPEALALLDRRIRDEPTHALHYAYRGFVKNKLGQPTEAEVDLDRALELDPRSPFALGQRGEAKAGQGRYDKAAEDFERALALAPQVFEYPWNLAICLRHLERWPEEIEALGLVLQLDPDSSRAYSRRAQAKANLGRHEEALEDYERALELDPRATENLLDRSMSHVQLGRLDDALADLDRALELQPKLGVACGRRGQVMTALGRDEDALADLDRALEFELPAEERAPVLVARAAVLQRLGRR